MASSPFSPAESVSLPVRRKLVADLLDVRIIPAICVVLQRHREPRLLRVAFVLLFSLASFSDAENGATLQRVLQELRANDLLALVMAVVQFLPVNSDALVSALNLLILLCRDDEARKRLYTCDCVVTLRKLLYLPNTPIDTQELCLSLLSRLSALSG